MQEVGLAAEAAARLGADRYEACTWLSSCRGMALQTSMLGMQLKAETICGPSIQGRGIAGRTQFLAKAQDPAAGPSKIIAAAPGVTCLA